MRRSIRSYCKKPSQETTDVEGYTKREVKMELIGGDLGVEANKMQILIKDNIILTTNLIEIMRLNYGLEEGDFLSYWDDIKKCYVNWCRIGDIDMKDLSQNLIVGNQLKLKVRKTKKSFVQNLMLEQKLPAFDSQDSSKQNHKEVPRDKQICEIIKKVSLWRLFYLGFNSFDGEYVKEPLDSAASRVGIAKKTLDDYLLQIRTAREIGFDFNSKKNNGIGQLRNFVKSRKRSVQK